MAEIYGLNDELPDDIADEQINDVKEATAENADDAEDDDAV